ncbi:MAG: hypothetical protein ACT4OO_13770 [Nitrospiraceae bacterium]
MDPAILSALTRPGNVIFPSNLSYVHDLIGAGGRSVRQFTGHSIFYDRNHRRFLAVDPDGYPLHECEWSDAGEETLHLKHARFRLDWGRWVGLRPGALHSVTTLDLSKKPGWQCIRPDDLRQMAAHAMRVPLDEVRFFYDDQDLTIDAQGRATIRHKKDALYVLDAAGTFDQAKFMACMGAMHWASIDFLPVVELFQSLLPGTGSAAFELIRGLYDDQNEGRSQPRPLRYRGIPAYPSAAAFRLFRAFFEPQAPAGRDPFPLFMDQTRAHEVTWLPAPYPSRRFFEESKHLCITVKDRRVQKVTSADDAAGLSYIHVEGNRVAPCERRIEVEGGHVTLIDRDRKTTIVADPRWGVLVNSTGARPSPSRIDWRSLLRDHQPQVSPKDAFGAVLLYPADDKEIDELSTQPFVADYVQDLMEQDHHLAACMTRSERVLIHRYDAVVNTLVAEDRPRDYTVFWQHGSWAQKQAQLLWNRFAVAEKLEWLTRITMAPLETRGLPETDRPYDMMHVWIPFESFQEAAKIRRLVETMGTALNVGGIGFIAGPAGLSNYLQNCRLLVVQEHVVESLPTFRMHRNTLPKAYIRAGLTLYQVRKGGSSAGANIL